MIKCTLTNLYKPTNNLIKIKKRKEKANIRLYNDMSKTDYTSLKNVDSIKYLGMWIDKKGKYEIHVKNMIDKFRQVMPKLYQIRNFLKITICKSWIESYLRYGIENYGNILVQLGSINYKKHKTKS